MNYVFPSTFQGPTLFCLINFATLTQRLQSLKPPPPPLLGHQAYTLGIRRKDGSGQCQSSSRASAVHHAWCGTQRCRHGSACSFCPSRVASCRVILRRELAQTGERGATVWWVQILRGLAGQLCSRGSVQTLCTVHVVQLKYLDRHAHT